MAGKKLQENRNSLRGYKAALSRKINAASDLIILSEDKLPESMKQSFTDLLTALDKASNAYEQALQIVIEQVEETEISSLEKDATQLLQKASEANKALITRLNELVSINKPTDVTTAQGGNGVTQHRVNEALKPHTLTLGHNMIHFKAWKNQFSSYYSSSHMDKCETFVQ